MIPMGSDHLPPPDSTAGAAHLARLGIHGPFLLSVGTLEPRKNQARLIEAYGRIRGSLPEPWPLVMVGPTGWGEQVAPATGVILAGLVSPAELSALYAMARLLAYVPLIEGFGLPPVEAMAFGTPVVASPLPSTAGAAHRGRPATTRTPSPTGCCGWPPTRTSGSGCTPSGSHARPSCPGRPSPGGTWPCGTRPGPSDRSGRPGGRPEPAALARRHRGARPAGGGRPVHPAAGRRPGRPARRRPGAVQPALGRRPVAGGGPGRRARARHPSPGRSGWPGSRSGSPGCWPDGTSPCTTDRTTPCPSARRCPPWSPSTT